MVALPTGVERAPVVVVTFAGPVVTLIASSTVTDVRVSDELSDESSDEPPHAATPAASRTATRRHRDVRRVSMDPPRR